ncbi:TolC family protein [Desulfofustis limnaeus]|uniref:Channel protein TolC n=1 Tax=Desulfofustis limnaeus TaxID=2740163 RepID=A0ABN6M7A6_9BACT|nr:TolC family protein [Desulfofustis limnaeus]BDD87696.1 channel protein TolC [Desulfofustis limnaeus]
MTSTIRALWPQLLPGTLRTFAKTPNWMGGALVILLALAVILSGAPSTVAALTLEEFVALARSREAGYQAAVAASAAERAAGWRDVADYGPRLQVSGSYHASRDRISPAGHEPVAADQAASFSESLLSVTAEQPIIDLERAGRLSRGLITMDLAVMQQRKAEEELVLSACERYYTALSHREGYRLARSETAALRVLVQAAEKRLELGFGTITDKHNAEARYRLSEASEISRLTELENALRALEELIDAPVDRGHLEDKPDSNLFPLTEPLHYWQELALQNNTDLRISRLRQTRTEAERRMAGGRFSPALMLFASHRHYRPDNGLAGHGEDRRETDIGLRLEMDLLAGGSDLASFSEASSRLRSAQAQVVAMERAVRRTVHSLSESIAATAELIEVYRNAVESNRLALEATQASFHEGAKVLLDVLNAQQDYYRSRKAYQTTRYDYLLLREKLKLTVGIYE